MMRILHVVGARPNFVKAAPVMAALAAHRDAAQLLVHTGQHYDLMMSEVFLEELSLPRPDVNLEVGSASHASQTAQVMLRLEKVLLNRRPDLVLVYGDVNSTLAAALVCAKLGIPIGHVEAGLRSFDRTMPEEINRVLTDQMADLLFTPSADGDENLVREGVPRERIHRVGNVMIDTLARLLPLAVQRWDDRLASTVPGQYALVTLHRPSNVDDPTSLSRTVNALARISERLPVLFPVHPRTRARLDAASPDIGTAEARDGLHLMEPLGYLDFLALMRHAAVVITDSGGIQEETTFLGVPCLTVRENTERPITITLGTNTLVGQDNGRLCQEVDRVLQGHGKRGQIPPLWDGHAADRIAEVVIGAHGP
jgi:UDP-N-acetylglucosamine 2-epimerase (non-hydrolysing)